MIATIILLTLHAMSIGVELAKHGEPKKASKHNFWVACASSALYITLYYFAGMFDKFI